MIRIPAALHAEAVHHLHQEHPFAGERVGFLLGRYAELTDHRWGILAQRYLPVPDDLYLPNPKVGAALSGTAIRMAMAESMRTDCSVVHVHCHDCPGPVFFSSTDLDGNREVLRSLRNANPRVPHGALVFGPTEAIAVLLAPGSTMHVPSPVSIVGFPLRLWGRSE